MQTQGLEALFEDATIAGVAGGLLLVGLVLLLAFVDLLNLIYKSIKQQQLKYCL